MCKGVIRGGQARLEPIGVNGGGTDTRVCNEGGGSDACVCKRGGTPVRKGGIWGGQARLAPIEMDGGDTDMSVQRGVVHTRV